MTDPLSKYPARLSVAELRDELPAYLEYRRASGKAGSTVTLESSLIGQFLTWLETGFAKESEPGVAEFKRLLAERLPAQPGDTAATPGA